MQGKILAYSLPPSQVLGHPALQSGSLGHVIGLYRQGKLDAALASLEGLMAHEKSAYFWEFKAQILFELRQFEAAAQAAENAIQQYVRANGILYLLLAQIKIAQSAPRDLQKAISLLEEAVALDPEDPQIWRWMSTAYGMSGQAGMAALCLGEESLRRGDVPRATEYAKKAVKTLGPGIPQRLRADDLVRHLKTLSL